MGIIGKLVRTDQKSQDLVVLIGNIKMLQENEIKIDKSQI